MDETDPMQRLFRAIQEDEKKHGSPVVRYVAENWLRSALGLSVGSMIYSYYVFLAALVQYGRLDIPGLFPLFFYILAMVDVGHCFRMLKNSKAFEEDKKAAWRNKLWAAASFATLPYVAGVLGLIVDLVRLSTG